MRPSQSQRKTVLLWSQGLIRTWKNPEDDTEQGVAQMPTVLLHSPSQDSNSYKNNLRQLKFIHELQVSGNPERASGFSDSGASGSSGASLPLPGANHGPISHMRLSHSGRWLVVCHHNACIIYDVVVLRFLSHLSFIALTIMVQNKREKILLGEHRSSQIEMAEHAAWAPGPGSIATSPVSDSVDFLLTRSKDGVRLWKIAESSDGTSTVRAIHHIRHLYVINSLASTR